MKKLDNIDHNLPHVENRQTRETKEEASKDEGRPSMHPWLQHTLGTLKSGT
jgi:hypothetical protein